MGMEHFLRVYPKPEVAKIYTGLFEKPVSERGWAKVPDSRYHGVRWTQYADAMEYHCSDNLSLFDFIHGQCGYFADYFHSLHPDWTVIDMMRGNSYGTMIHSYCIKKIDGVKLFADARGITDDPEVFFADFTCSKNMYVEKHKKTTKKAAEIAKKMESGLKKAYEYTYAKEPILIQAMVA